MSDEPTGNVTSPAVMLSPNARKRVFDNCASLDTVTGNSHEAVRFKESVAVHFTSVMPIGKVSPEDGEHVTLTEPWPPVTGGASKLTAMPAAFTVAREMPSTHDSEGASATGGGGGGGGVGAVGLLHAAPSASVTAIATPITQDCTIRIDLNQPFYRTSLIDSIDPGHDTPGSNS